MKASTLYLFLLVGVNNCKSQLLFEGRPVWGTSPQLSDRSTVITDLDTQTKQLEQTRNCVCVLYYLCDSDNYITTNGAQIIDIRGNFKVQRIVCPNTQYVCCKKRTNSKGSNRSSQQINQNPKHRSQHHSLSFRDSKCGIQKPRLDTRIFTDDTDFSSTFDGEFPWMVAIFKKNSAAPGNYSFKCAGSLIHQKVILTAYHCVSGEKPSNFRVLSNGKTVLNNIGEDIQNERSVTRIIKHTKYNPQTVAYDIALLILNKKYPKNFSRNILCLKNPTETFYNKSCIAAGWGEGSTQHDGRKVLRKVELSTVIHSNCESKLRNTRLGHNFKLHPSFLCAGGDKGKDTCSGDGGGPLICPLQHGGNKYIQYGITSWGIGCAQQDVPGVYVKVPYFYDWIVRKFNELQLS